MTSPLPTRLPPPAPLPLVRRPAPRRRPRAAAPSTTGPATWLLSFGLAFLGGMAYWQSAVPLRLEVDGQARALRSRAGTVGTMLREAGVRLDAGDHVQPPIGARLQAGARVKVIHARSWLLKVDGRRLELRSLAPNPAGVLAEAGILLGPSDRLLLDGRISAADAKLAPLPGLAPPVHTARRVALAAEAVPPEGAPPADPNPNPKARLRLEVLRARPFTVVEDGVTLAAKATGATVEEALMAAGFALDADDELAPARQAPYRPGMTVLLSRATSLVVQADGETRQLRVSGSTVGQALARAGLALGGRDYSIPGADAPLQADMTVKVVRVREDVQLKEEEIPFETETQVDAELPLGENEVLREGQSGLIRRRIVLTYENGRLMNRQVAEEERLREPVSQLLRTGSKVVWRTVETEQGPMRYFARLRVYATSYSAARAGTPITAPWYGYTRSGQKMRRGIVAVDRKLFPLGTNLYVPGYGVGLAGDTGGGIKNFHIDLGYDDDNYVSWHQWVELYLLEPVPPGMDLSRLVR
ncbi:MAG TPA: ubiquitin-like domain-containing protein [Anaerolineae bacterium]|nr:ubiquitin-like domain-containing protein [Anaerolineae bacterium]HRA20877.1 ubiquitin-like domain-containing protein [Anaerolineae bacterium]